MESRVTLAVRPHPAVFDDEDALPRPVFLEYGRVVKGLCKRPFSGGLGYAVDELRKRKLAFPAWSAHFWKDPKRSQFQYRILYVVDGRELHLYGVGPREGFYRRLDRLKEPLLGMGSPTRSG